jgi:hypothetical protein
MRRARLSLAKDRLQACCARLPIAKDSERGAGVVLDHRPVERHPLAGPLLQRYAKGFDRLLQMRRARLSLAKDRIQACRARLPIAKDSERGVGVVLDHRSVKAAASD